MELKNVNPNGWNVVIHNLHPIYFFFQNTENIEKGVQRLF